MGGYIGYNLMYNQQASMSQALWSREDENAAPVSTPVRPRVALVNMADNLRSCAMAGLRAWLDVADEVEVEFPTVTFVEDEEAGAITGLAAEVRRAALFAWVELKERKEMDAPVDLKPLCCVVFRSITEVDGQALDAWDVQEVELRRWHGKRFVTRHCVGASVDGKHAMVLMHDVEGVIDVGPAAALAGGRVSDCGTLVRQYGAPSAASFRRWRLSAEAPSSSTPVQPPATSLLGLGVGLRDGKRCQLWQSPLHIFAALGSVLRYNRTDAAVYPNHVTTPVLVSQSASAVSASLWGCMKELALRCTSPLLHWYMARQSERMERQRQLSSTFVVVVSLAEESAAVTSDVLRVVEEYVAEWMRDMNGASPMKTSLPTSNRVCARDAAAGTEKLLVAPMMQVDLTDIICSVIAAEWLLIRLISLVAALGLEPALAQLVAVPGPQASTSLLYPTPNTAHLRHLWLPRSALASSSTSTDKDATSLRMTRTGRTTQGGHFVGCAATTPIEAGFVVSEHDFSAF
ncbi:conserved hypothetical protein [Leishmania mexicana MHOM/GT/2001/U1103]|uniref:Uncharacterized protein n=1 Tax=Leishmania mexicana (strain MHOM/GT/2001/U1103) TaxID=929439 RepID=E9B3J7_LEIMU|nr:conserved hypothetical protein [Leishmania mexicana MHOM/GT/2001/U1103]CBZ29814.1 conserved hypothetical protein [Leishmania mexicana MHOM/GT/2001/U1103]